MAYADKQTCDIALAGLLASLAHHLKRRPDGSLPLNLNFSRKSYSPANLQEICDWTNAWLIADERNNRVCSIKQRADWFILYILPADCLN